MLEKPYISTFFKSLFFLVACLLIRGISYKLLPEQIQAAVPAGLAILLTYVFLKSVEREDREFFSPTYGNEGMACGLLLAIVTVGAPVGILWLMGQIDMKFTPENIDWLKLVLCGCEGIFCAMLIYGYTFHIVREDIGWVAAGILSIGLNILYMDVFVYDFIPDPEFLKFDTFAGLMTIDPAVIEWHQWVAVINVVILCVLAFIMSYRYGDVRPAATFMFSSNVAFYLISHMFTTQLDRVSLGTGMEMLSSLVLTGVMVLEIVVMIITI